MGWLGCTQADEAASRPAGIAQRGPDRIGLTAQEAVFFTLYYVCAWLVVEPRLIFHGAGIITDFPSFYSTRRFLVEHLSYPGGPVEYIAAFGSQMFYYSPLGALVITVQAWMLCLCTAYVLRASGLKKLALVGYVPSLLLLVLYDQYAYYVPTTMALLAALAFVSVYVGLARRNRSWISAISFFVLSLASYYTAGGAFLLFAAVCVIYELWPARRWTLGLGYAVLGAALPYAVGVLGFDINPGDAYSQLLPLSWKLLDYEARSRLVGVVYALYLLVPAAMIAARVLPILWAEVRHHRGETPSRKHRRKKRTRFNAAVSWYTNSPRLEWLVQTTILLAVGAAVAFGALDRNLKTRFAMDYYAYHEMWPEIIATGTTQAEDRFVMHAVDRALYHTGQLGNEMFRWPQRPEYLFPTGTNDKRTLWESIDTHLEAGSVNWAEHALTECLEGLGDRPMVLQRLALINMVKGNIGTARVYLGALSKTLFHHDWARQYLELLDRDPGLSTDAQIQHLRSIAMDRDFPSVALGTETVLQWLLTKNSKNRMAFEYLMAWHLLNKRLAKFTEQLGAFRNLGYSVLPTHVEEAALVYVYGTGKPLYLGGYEPRVEVRRRVEHFTATMKRYHGNKQAALAELMKYHHGTYFFYHVYAQPGKAN